MEALVQFILKNFPEVKASHTDDMPKVMYYQGRRDAALELLKFMGRDEGGNYIGNNTEGIAGGISRGSRRQ